MLNTIRKPKRRTLAATGLGAVLLLATLTACNSDDSTDATASKPAVTLTTTAPSSSDDDVVGSEKAKVPDLVGMNHQAAQDELQSLGFYGLREKDATGLDRMLLWDRNWQVCDQDPLPGTYPTTTEVTLYSVKIGESCPP